MLFPNNETGYLPDDTFILSIILVPGPRIELRTLIGYTKCIQMAS